MTNLILHIPHSSDRIPMDKGYVVGKKILDQEIIKLTDWYTDELFFFEDSIIIKADFSRIFCDTERFSEDSQEVMAYSHDSRVFFALKEFRDITNFYDNLPTSYDPICNMDSITFDTQGNVKLCCIDHKNSTQFSNVKNDDMKVIFKKYVGQIKTSALNL